MRRGHRTGLKARHDAARLGAGGSRGANPKELEDLKAQNVELTQRLLNATTRENQAHVKVVELNEELRRRDDERKQNEET